MLVVVLVAGAWLLGGPTAAGLAAWCARLSPFVERYATLVMSDAFGATLAVLVLVLLLLARARVRAPARVQHAIRAATPTLIGFVAGYAVLTRLGAAMIPAAAVLAMTSWRDRRWLALGAMVPLLFLAAYQWTEFGSPLRSGYDYYVPELPPFDLKYAIDRDPVTESIYITPDRLNGDLMDWTCPCTGPSPMGETGNAVFYPALLLGAYWVIAPPLIPLFGLWELARRRRERATWYAVAVIVAHLVLYLGYYYQGARLVAPAACLLLVYGCAGVANAGRALWSRARRRARPAVDEITPTVPDGPAELDEGLEPLFPTA